jgi:hypothetical protein
LVALQQFKGVVNMRNKIRFGLGIVYLIIFSSCQGNDRLAEKAAIESQVSAANQNKVQYEFLVWRAQAMEADLRSRHRFYEGIKGDYEGIFADGKQEYQIRLSLAPSLPLYLTDRVRTLEELTADFNNLHLNAMIQIWKNDEAAVSCTVEKIKPDVKNGEINIITEKCPNAYQFYIGDGVLDRKHVLNHDLMKKLSPERILQAQILAGEVLAGARDDIPEMFGFIKPATNSQVYHFVANKIALSNR